MDKRLWDVDVQIRNKHHSIPVHAYTELEATIEGRNIALEKYGRNPGRVEVKLHDGGLHPMFQAICVIHGFTK